LGASAFLFVAGLVTERSSLRRTILQGGFYGMGAGLLNGVKNAANLALILTIPLSVLSPLKKGVHMPLGFVVARFIYKEKYT
jgi:hypothetical protein